MTFLLGYNSENCYLVGGLDFWWRDKICHRGGLLRRESFQVGGISKFSAGGWTLPSRENPDTFYSFSKLPCQVMSDYTPYVCIVIKKKNENYKN